MTASRHRLHKRSLSPGLAVVAGSCVVNLPVFALLVGPALVAAGDGHGDILPLVLLLSFAAAWGWWSFMAPRWRLWAYARVQSTGVVHRMAVAAGLLWPRGSLFERTEIRSAAQRRRQERLERRFP